MLKLLVILFIGLIIIVYICTNPKKQSFKLKTYVINLEKNVNRWKVIKKSIPYGINVERFDAIVGKDVYINKWLNEKGLRTLKEVEKNGYRTKHYQLTRGAIGCFLSHYTLAKKLLNDANNEMYLILEDDAGIKNNTFNKIHSKINQAKSVNWDILLLGTHRLHGDGHVTEKHFVKVNGFWGLFGYLINKEGARKLVNFVDDMKIDAQLDALMSWMSQKGYLNIYASNQPIIFDNNIDKQTDIQINLKEKKGINPFIYKGLHL